MRWVTATMADVVCVLPYMERIDGKTTSCTFDDYPSALRGLRASISMAGTAREGKKRIRFLNPGLARVSFLFYGVAYGVASLGCSLPVFILIVLQGAAALDLILRSSRLITSLLAKGVIHERLLSVMPYMKRVNGIVLIVAGAYMLYVELIR